MLSISDNALLARLRELSHSPRKRFPPGVHGLRRSSCYPPATQTARISRSQTWIKSLQLPSADRESVATGAYQHRPLKAVSSSRVDDRSAGRGLPAPSRTRTRRHDPYPNPVDVERLAGGSPSPRSAPHASKPRAYVGLSNDKQAGANCDPRNAGNYPLHRLARDYLHLIAANISDK